MGLWYLLGAILGSSSLVIILKVFDLKGVNLYVGITTNYVVGAVLSFLSAPVCMSAGEILGADWLGISMLIGATFMLALVVFGISAQRSGVAITTISGRAAVFVPVVFAFAVLGEQPTALKIAMLALILVAMYMILKKSGQGAIGSNAVNNRWVYLLPVAVFLFNGASDTMVQYAQKEVLPQGDNDLYAIFNGMLFVGGALTGIVCYIVSCIRNRKLYVPKLKDFGWGALLGFMNWVCMMGVFNALSVFDGSVFYPLYYTGAIIVSTIVGVWIFRERLSAVNWIGVGLAVVAIAVLATQ